MLAFISTLLVFLLSLIGAACDLNKNPKRASKKIDKTIEVYVTQAESRTLFTPIKFAGLVHARREIPLYAPMSGIVSKLHVQEGTRVSKDVVVLSLLPLNYGLDYKPYQQKITTTGTLIVWNVKEGDYVSQGQELGLVADLSAFETTVQATYADLSSLPLGSELDLKISPASSLEITTKGKIIAVIQRADPVYLTFPVRIAIDCSAGSPCSKAIRLGSLVEAQAAIDKRQALLLPSLYLQRRGTKVISVDAQGKIRWLPIQIGQVFDDKTEITQGIEAATLIVSSFSQRPKEGETVEIAQRNSP